MSPRHDPSPIEIMARSAEPAGEVGRPARIAPAGIGPAVAALGRAQRLVPIGLGRQRMLDILRATEGASRPTLIRNVVRWPDYVKRREDAATVLLYQSDVLFQFLPERAFTAPQMASLRPHLDGVPVGRGPFGRAARGAPP